MRTTVTIDDALYRRTKAAAARAGRTVSELVEDALRQNLAAKPASDAVPELPTFGGSGTLPGVDLTSNAALLATMDADAGLDALR